MRLAAPLLVAAVVASGIAAWRALVGVAPPPAAPALTIAAAPPRPLAESPPIRVNLTPDPAARLRIAVDGPYQARPVGSSQVLGRGARLAECESAAAGTGLTIGGTTYPVARLEIVPESSPAVWVDDHQYRGTVRLYRRPGDTLLAVNVLPLEEYVAAVIDGEMPASFPPAAREAQAVVARSYALAQMARRHPQFDVYATTRSQNYLGFQYRDGERRLAGESADSREIAERTRGMVCTHEGRLFATYYSAVCGGETVAGESVFGDAAPPHARVPCPWCADASLYRWTRRAPAVDVAADLRRAFGSRMRSLGRPRTLTETNAGMFALGDGRRTYAVSATELRGSLTAVSLPSPRFTARVSGSEIVFEGRGHGHGVGLCQWGARGMALAGHNCLDILRHYYPGAEVVVME